MIELVCEICLLSERPDYIPELVQGLIATWGEADTPERRQERSERLRQHLNRNSLPLALVAHDGEQALGVVALRLHDLDGQEDLGPWLGGLFVIPRARERGVGSRLCHAALEHALSLDIEELYLFTLDRESMYRRLGFRHHAAADWSGRSGTIMVQHLSAAAGRGQSDPIRRVH